MYRLQLNISDSNGKDFPLITMLSNHKYGDFEGAVERAKMVIELMPKGSVIKIINVAKAHNPVVSKCTQK